MWVPVWLAGQVAIGAVGRYGSGARNILPAWIDILVVVVFSLVIFYWAVALTMSKSETATAVAKDAQQINYQAV